MTDIELINKVLKSKKPSDIFTSNWKKEYIGYSKLIHPDYCNKDKAGDAMATLNTYKAEISFGVKGTDDSGDYKRFSNRIVYHVNEDNEKLLKKSVENYTKLKKKAVGNFANFAGYLPHSMKFVGDQLIVVFNNEHRAIPVVGLKLPQTHVNWVFSRMFEFCLFVRGVGFSHMGINPETIFIVPESHGIQCTSFYHLTPLTNKAKTFSSRYKNWYPTTLFTEKKATGDIDLELSKKIAISLLGDVSGAGTKLRRVAEVNNDILTFLIGKHDGDFNDYDKYRKIVTTHFENKFYTLNI